MRIATIIGTRPNYIKVKPIADFYAESEDFVLIDTNQHYSQSMSDNLVSELGLRIDHNLRVENVTTLGFLSGCLSSLGDLLCSVRPDVVLVIGDTNSTLAASLASNKLGIPLAHIEAGVRCGDRGRPEEVNRVLIDELASLHFISRETDASNVSNPIYIGDLEYVLLNSFLSDGLVPPFCSNGSIVMTLHRSDTVTPELIREVFRFCSSWDGDVVFPAHHRTLSIISGSKIDVPSNVSVVEPMSYLSMIRALSCCSAVISDSGGVVKTMPFFGKRCLVPAGPIEWSQTVRSGFVRSGLDMEWLCSEPPASDRSFYLCDSPLSRIDEALRAVVGE